MLVHLGDQIVDFELELILDMDGIFPRSVFEWFSKLLDMQIQILLFNPLDPIEISENPSEILGKSQFSDQAIASPPLYSKVNTTYLELRKSKNWEIKITKKP